VLSIGVFFTIITLGLAAALPGHLYAGLVSNGVPSKAARQVADSARAAGLSTVIELPAGAARGPLRITLRPVSFATLMPWLAGLRAQGVVVDALQLDAAGAGRVQGRATLDRIPAGNGTADGGSD
jgi:type II secretory pathway component PulM